MKALKPYGELILKDFLLNNHNEGNKIINDMGLLEDYIQMAINNDGKLQIHESEVSHGGCYLLTLVDEYFYEAKLS
jgi:hypothetical protein